MSCDGGDGVSCEGGGAKRDGGSLMDSHEASTSGAVSTGVSGKVKRQPVTFNPHGGSVLSLKVSGHDSSGLTQLTCTYRCACTNIYYVIYTR